MLVLMGISMKGSLMLCLHNPVLTWCSSEGLLEGHSCLEQRCRCL